MQVSSFKFQDYFRKPFWQLATCTLLLLTTACGFSPVYGTGSYETGVAQELAQVRIGNIPDREGQALRNLLVDRFYRNGAPDSVRYTLDVERLSESLVDLDITKTADSTRGQLRIDTVMRLKKAADGAEVLNRRLRAVTSYNILASEFATRVSEENARQNAISDLARQIESQLALYFKR